ncbi:DeoR family transcriptional regulator [Chelativorans sp. ZYF759]|uniref:DeoR/GlpR family DNA-binding transcription regulator n=1 Tax=Chelativorans sp. ZYF759 TaxID=2692213 RepID=UPI00145D2490|nr:DeoR/GlpR family DNA-binding transcription regulator [Chelativorans sp. ZYF759]NMG39314.1 DeoR family transcriptional regulator [Chelativorans sp. ZYF759]
MMHWTARHRAIMTLVQQNGSCRVAELMQHLGVSDETVRRDLRVLADKGLVDKVHGGAMMPASRLHEDPFAARLRMNAQAKRMIAELVAAEVHDGDSLMLDTGSTTVFVARALTRRRNLVVITNNGEIGRILAGGQGNKVYVAGGEIRGDDGAVFGEAAIDFLTRFRVDRAILSAGGIHPETGLMDYHLPEAETARAMAARAERTMVVADHSKFLLRAPVAALALERLDMIVTDRAPPPVTQEALEREGVVIRTPAGDSRPIDAALTPA